MLDWVVYVELGVPSTTNLLHHQSWRLNLAYTRYTLIETVGLHAINPTIAYHEGIIVVKNHFRDQTALIVKNTLLYDVCLIIKIKLSLLIF